ncbi:Helix-turn-helix domain-containing protein [Lentzea jiangxiensis]|uniref:Helix-turn-helix domain-containing protein n=1 Tax=Lentzea jiangxiensis TaxID=641025 RepID=A0A1H0X8Q7_9PSEU|nr:Helix-turn-helix domain-containing protein [Lentzea jiangxiensis]
MAGGREELACHLAALKQRSGLSSCSEWGRKSHISSSTLHRYCSGTTVPPDCRTVVGIATACSADDEELVELLAQWRVATGQAALPEIVRPAPESRRSPRPRTFS